MSATPQILKKNGTPMERKPILMPIDMVARVVSMATQAGKKENRSVSFAEIVRRAVNQYDPISNQDDENQLLEAMVDTWLASNRKTIKAIDELTVKLNKTHKQLEESRRGLDG